MGSRKGIINPALINMINDYPLASFVIGLDGDPGVLLHEDEMVINKC
jgi:hypothetical protein